MSKLVIRIGRFAEKSIWLLTVALFSSFFILDMNTEGSMIQFVLSVLVLLLSALTYRGRIRFKLEAFHSYIFLFASFCLLSGLWALNSLSAIQQGFTIFQILISMSMLYINYSRHSSVEPLIKIIMWSGFVVSIYAIIFYYGLSRIAGIILSAGRIGNEFANSNSIGILAAYAIVISVYFMVYHRPRLSQLLTIPCIVMVAASGSRKALIALVIGILLLLMQRYASKKIIINVLKLSLVLLLAYFALNAISSMQLFDGVNKRMEGLVSLFTGEGKVDNSTFTRQRFIEAGIEQFRQTPLLGVGMGNSHFVAASYGERETYLHNNYVEILASGGIVGFICYYAMYAYIGVKLWKFRKAGNSMTALLITLLILILILDYGVVSYYSKTTYFNLLIFFLYIKSLENNERYFETVFSTVRASTHF